MLILTVLFSGCSTIVHKPLTTSAPSPHKIAIFFDGTHNDIASDTNVKRLHSLVSLQGKTNISTLYVEGVGTGYDVLGMGFGFGMGPRVRIGYEFILNHYHKGDQIYIFGFSRGAFAARILASMLYNAGIVSKNGIPALEVAKVVYDEFKYPIDEATAKADTAITKIDEIEAKKEDSACKEDESIPKGDESTRKDKVRKALECKKFTVTAPVSVEVLGLWDTVGAMGFPNWKDRILHKAGIQQYIPNIDVHNSRYGDQLCNVKRAYQALSIDDNREWVFTPLPLDRTHLFSHCGESDGTHILDKKGKIRPGHLREVWFSGAHSDVGGGYDDSLLSGVSLNWMIDNLKADDPKYKGFQGYNHVSSDLLPADAKVPEDPFGTSHDPEAGWWGPLYHNVNRDIGTYMIQNESRREEFKDTLCVHPLVLKRRSHHELGKHENNLLSLRKEGMVSLCPKRDHEGWEPRLHERMSDILTECEKKILDVQVWPNCEGMK